MTREVFTNDMVAHTYAQQSQNYGRSGNGNFHFTGAALYSYSTIMNVVGAVAGETVLFKNAESYSVTSTQHVISAYSMPGTVCQIDVYNAPNPNDCYPDGTPRDVQSGRIMKDLETAYGWTLHTLTTGGTRREFDHDSKIRRNAEKRAGVSIVRGLLRRAAECQGKAKRARKDSYIAMHERDAANALTQAQWIRESMRIKSLVTMPDNLESLVAELEAKRAKAREAEKAREARLREVQREDFDLWLIGGPVSCPRSFCTDESGSVYMRVKRDELQTSMGVRVPLDHAKAAFRMAKFCRKRGEGWKRNGSRIQVGGFQVDSINAQGDIVAGCHKLSFKRMNECAKRAGLEGLEAVDVTRENA